MRAFKVGDRAMVTDAKGGTLQRYRNDIRAQWGKPDLTDGPVVVVIYFNFARPRSHFNAAGEVKQGTKYKHPVPDYVITQPDIDKCARAVLDALTGYAYHDDNQVAYLIARKRYAREPSTSISIRPVEGEVLA